MRFTVAVLAAILSSTMLHAAHPSAPMSSASENILSVDFTVSGKTTIPGKTISAGHYKISIIEHLADRVILQVTNPDGKVESTFLGLINSTLGSSGSAGPITWMGKGNPALRGFAFPGAPPVEFVYPKVQAVAIAKTNPEKVLAVDPASDNLSVSHDRLSTQDMQIVTLWTLKSTRVGPDAQPAIEAARYQVEPPPAAVPAAPVYEAKATPAPVLRAPGTPAAARTKAPVQSSSAAPVVRKKTIAALPHTGSNLSELYLAAILALLGSAALRLRRVYGR